ncbi:50S ribosomal protein L6 [bacterium]|nr:50S ribosomal protein L6 [bacterium]
MSRIGKKPIEIPKDTEIKIDGRKLTVKGPKGTLSHTIPECIEWKLDDGVLSFICEKNDKRSRALFGTTRSIVASQIVGVIQGFQKALELHGQGYKAALKGDKVELHVGFSHPVLIPFEKDKVLIEVKQISNKLATIKVSGIDKAMVGHYADQIRRVKPPDSYRAKGGQDENKGIRYKGERIRTKAGKSSA